LQDTVTAWVKDQWVKRQLQADHIISCLRAAAEGVVDKEPEEAFEEILEPVTKQTAAGAPLDPVLARKALDEIVKLVGRPDAQAHVRSAALVEGLDAAAKTLLGNCEQKLAEMAVHLVEQPKFRFAGADEAIRQIGNLIEETIQRQETLAQEFTAKAQEAYSRLIAILEALKTNPAAGKRKVAGAPDPMDLMRLFPNMRFKALMLQHVLTVYRSLRGTCPEYLREFTYCRTRLTDLLKTFDKLPASATAPLDLGPSRQLLPAGCRNLDETVNKVLDGISGDDLLELDKRVQAVIQRQLKAMVHVCTTPAMNILREVEALLTQELESYVKTRLGASNAIETFLDQYPREDAAQNQLAAAFEDAMPQLDARGLSSKQHLAILMVPSDPAAERFGALAQEAIPQVELLVAAKADDIVFYREAVGIKLSELPQLGPDGRAAYEKLAGTDHFTPHCRSDVGDWRKVT